MSVSLILLTLFPGNRGFPLEHGVITGFAGDKTVGICLSIEGHALEFQPVTTSDDTRVTRREDLCVEIFKKYAAYLVSCISYEIEGPGASDIEIAEHERIGTADLDTRLGYNLDGAAVECAAIVLENDVRDVHIAFVVGIEIPGRIVGENTIISLCFDILEKSIPDGIVGRTAETYGLAAGIELTIADNDIFTDNVLTGFLSHSPQDDTVIASLEARIAHPHIAAPVEIDTVVVYHALVGGYRDTLDNYIAAETQKHGPAW